MYVAFSFRIREIDGLANDLQKPPMNGWCLASSGSSKF
jgi:hypothetical protein